MTLALNRGGAKPQMLNGGRDLAITIGTARKGGIYELSARGDVLARRVELPSWLSEIWARSGQDVLLCALHCKKPANALPESQGHIFFNPPSSMFACPAVGLDQEPYNRVMNDPRIKNIRFFVYASGYRLAGVWNISTEDFLLYALMVRTKGGFMSQMMVPLTALSKATH
jgi:hypothetical protein